MEKVDMLCGPARYCMSCGGRLASKKAHGRKRHVCGRCGRVYFKSPASASAVAVVSGGKVVLVRRRYPPRAGSWCLPAGFQEFDESPEETAVREAKEETNLDVRLRGLYRIYFSKAYPGKNTVVHLYLAEPVAGKMRPGDDAVEVRAFPLEKLPARIAFRRQMELLEALREGRVRIRREAGSGGRAARPPRRRRKKRIKVAVVMGGRTAEHDVSISTGTVIVRNLSPKKYDVKPVVISRRGQWRVPAGFPGGRDWSAPEGSGGGASFVSVGEAITRLIEDRVDVVFIALHGPYGEDGTIQGMLEMIGLAYTGSDVCASALAMDKIMSKAIYGFHGLRTPRHLVCDASGWRRDGRKLLTSIASSIGYPCVLKPSRLGSSVGSSICASRSELAARIESAFRYDRRVLVEEFIRGREFTCAVLETPGGKPPVALPPTEIVPRTSAYFDYEAKYTPGATSEITPAPVGGRTTSRIQRAALRAHAALGCEAMSRTDMILRGGSLYVLETNTIPGMTVTSLLPRAAKAHGLSFPRLLDRIVMLALESHRAKRCHSRTE